MLHGIYCHYKKIESRMVYFSLVWRSRYWNRSYSRWNGTTREAPYSIFLQFDVRTAFFIFPGDFLPHRPEPARAHNRHVPPRPLVRVVPAPRLWDERGQRLPSLLPSGQAALPEACILQRRHTFYQVCGGVFILNDDVSWGRRDWG